MKLYFKHFNKLYMVLIQYFLSYIFTITFNIYKPGYIFFLSLGIFVFNFIGAYILENTNNYKKKILLMANYIINFICSVIYFFYYRGHIHLANLHIEILWFIIGTTLTFGTNYFLQTLTIYYKENIKIIYNISNIFLWLIVAFFIHFKKFIINENGMYFLIYTFFIFKLLYLIYYDKDDKKAASLPESSSIKEFFQTFFIGTASKDKNFIICCVLFISILHVQFYSLLGLSVNILYLLLGGIISSIIFNFVTINNMKFFLLSTVAAAVIMFYVPHIYQSIISGILASSIFFTYQYIYTFYTNNMCKIYSVLNIFNFLSKNFLILYYFYLKSFVNFKILYSFLLVGLFTYILLKFKINLNQNKTKISDNLKNFQEKDIY